MQSRLIPRSRTPVLVTARLKGDVKARYGMYPQQKWDKNLWLKGYFEEKMGMDVYRAVGKETFRVSGTLAR